MSDASVDLRSLAETNNEFALDLYSQLSSHEGNIFFSPYSIRAVLAMAYSGARGRTAEQIAQVLHLTAGDPDLPRAFGALNRKLGSYQRKDEIELDIANALWAQRGFRILDEFLRLLSADFGCALRTADFAGAAQEACDEINRWVSDKTHGRIQGLVNPLSFSDLTGLVLTNAVYFKGMWKSPFDKDMTQPEEFKLKSGESAGASVEIPTMHQTDRFGYIEHPGLQVLEMPYAGEDLSMVILLPDRIDGLKGLEESLSEPALAMWMQLLREQKVEVYVPKFKLSSRFDLADMLGKMGMEDAFELDKADFKGMTAEDRFAISAVIHKAEIDVGEEGTEAAAVSLIDMAPMAGPPSEPVPIPVFRADHPFLFLIRATRLNCILFMCRVENPQA
jgi:serpin B